MWEFFLNKSRLTYLFIVVLLVLGGYSVFAIPKESAPEVVIPIGVVNTILLGAPAADVESLVTNELERGLASLADVKKITSTSREGFSSIVVEFEARADLDASIQDLKDKVDTLKTSLPDDAEDPQVTEVDFVNQPILTITVAGPVSDLELSNLAREVEEELEKVSGVARVETSGVREPEVAVIVNQESLRRFGIGLSEVTNAIRSANLTLPVGQIVSDGITYNVAFEGDVPNTSAIADIAVASRGGQPVFLRDIATVEDGLAPAATISRLSVEGKPSENAITFNVYKVSGGDITAIARAVNARVASLTEPGELLAGFKSKAVQDAGEQIETDLINLTTSGLQTVILVVLVLMLTIGWREGFLAGLAIPLSFLIGFIGLYFSGNTINFLSLFSLILGVGILVDSAIVIVEGISRRLKDDPTISQKEAASRTVRDFAAPLISGTLTTVVMFVGLFVVSGVTGQFIASIPFTLIFLLFASLFVVLAIIPLFATVLLKRRSASRFESKQVLLNQRFEEWYRRKLAAVIDSPQKQQRFLSGLLAALVVAFFLPVNIVAGLLAGGLVYASDIFSYHLQMKRKLSEWKRKLIFLPLLVASIVLAVVASNTILPNVRLIEVVFFDQSDADYLIVELEEPEGTTKETTDIAVRRVEELLYGVPEIESFSVTVGSGSQFGSGGSGEKYANIFVNLGKDRERTSVELIASLREAAKPLRDIKVTFNQPSDGPPTGAAVTVKYLGDDLDQISELADETAKLFATIPNTINIETSTDNNGTEFVLELDRERAAAVGLNPLVVSQVARTALFGAEATTLTTIDEEIPVVVKLNIGNDSRPTSDSVRVTDINALAGITLPTAGGEVPLDDLVKISLRESNSAIGHEAGTRLVSITADVAEGGNVRDVQAEILRLVDERLDLPEGVELSTGGGETEESNKAFMEMFAALIVGVLLMVVVLVIEFNSYLHTRYVLSILPYSLIGVLGGLALMQSTLSFPSIMGFIALSGIIVNNAILLIDMMNQMRRSDPKRSLREVVLQSSVSRLRPILLTSITTIIGMIPLTFAGDLWAPLAYAVMFGLVFSVIITLVLVPITYLRKPGDLPE